MARRGGQRKVGLKRIDAAIDALTPMGFSPELIRRKVDKLLEEYGEDGWPFIEDSAYKVLLECILDDDSEDVPPEQGEPSCRDSPNEERYRDDEEEEPAEVGSSGDDASEPTAMEAPLNNTPLASPVPVVVPNPTLSHAENVPNPRRIAASTAGNRTNDILVEQEKIAAFSSVYSGPPGFEHILHKIIAPSKRKPCLGWIGPKDDADFVLLEPAPFLGWSTGERRRKRKSRWDVRPDDVV